MESYENCTITEMDEPVFEEWLAMALDLWPDESAEYISAALRNILASPKDAAFICRVDGEYAGFINLSLRSDYVEGSNSSPVGYVEGIYVKERYRKLGLAKKLLEKGEAWAIGRGCTEMASDIHYDNSISYEFHTKAGFTEAGRLICFIKAIGL